MNDKEIYYSLAGFLIVCAIACLCIELIDYIADSTNNYIKEIE